MKEGVRNGRREEGGRQGGGIKAVLMDYCFSY